MSEPAALPLAVCVLLRRGDGRILIIERAAGRFAAGYWTPVTGRLERGETLAAAAAREVREEVGLEAVIGREVLRTGTERPGGGSAGFELVWLEAVCAPGQDPDALRLAPDEVARAEWLSVEEALAKEPLFETTRRALREAHGM